MGKGKKEKCVFDQVCREIDTMISEKEERDKLKIKQALNECNFNRHLN